MPNIKDITITPEMLTKIVEIEHFNGTWQSGFCNIGREQLKVMKRIATIESVGSSNRIEGNKMSDTEVEELFSAIDICHTLFKHFALP